MKPSKKIEALGLTRGVTRPHTLKEIADGIGVTREHLSLIAREDPDRFDRVLGLVVSLHHSISSDYKTETLALYEGGKHVESWSVDRTAGDCDEKRRAVDAELHRRGYDPEALRVTMVYE